MINKMFKKPTSSDATPMPILDLSGRQEARIGQTGTDKITGFSGVITALVYEIDGSLLVGLQQKALMADGKPADVLEFDIERLDISGDPAKLPAAASVREKVRLGAIYRDRITGVEGTAIRYIEFLAGCAHIGLSLPVDKDGKIPDGFRTSAARLEMVDDSKAEEMASVRTPTGGPGDREAGMLSRIDAR